MHFTKKQNNVQNTFPQSYFSADKTFFNKSLLDFIISQKSQQQKPVLIKLQVLRGFTLSSSILHLLPDHILLISTSLICLQEFEVKEDHVSCLLKIERIIKHLERHNQTLTNWNGSCFPFPIISHAFSACWHLSLPTLPIFSAFFTYAYMDLAYFIKFSSMLSLRLR